MLRALAPSFLIAALIDVGSGIGYGLGGPAWLVHAGLLASALAVLPAYMRWDDRQHPHH